MVLRLLHVQILQDGYMIQKELMLNFLRRLRKLREQDLQSMQLQERALNTMRVVEYGRLSVMWLFHVLHRMSYSLMMLSS